MVVIICLTRQGGFIMRKKNERAIYKDLYGWIPWGNIYQAYTLLRIELRIELETSK